MIRDGVPPKGHTEEGETIEETAIRETIEETGYQNIKIIKPLKTVHIQYPWTDGTMNYKTIHWFQAELIDDTQSETALEPYEIETQIKQEWFDIDSARKALKFDDERELLDLL